MAALTLAYAAAAMLAAPAPVALTSCSPGSCPAAGVAAWRGFIVEASQRIGVPEAWIERVMLAESGGRTTLGGRPIRSPKGAMGLMQLMPGTWAEMRARLGLGKDPDDPRDNIFAGTLYLRLMYLRFGYPGLFGAYNAGPARYAAWLEGRASLPAETIAYLHRLGVAPQDRPRTEVGAIERAREADLFVPLAKPVPAPEADAATRSGDDVVPAGEIPPGLFAIRRPLP